jgi:hypothetical protein
MPHADAVPSGVLDDVAAQIGARLSLLLSARPLAPGDRVTITESFQIFHLSAERVRTSSSNDLRALAEPTEDLHHQVAINGAPELFARSSPQGSAAPGRAVVEVTASPLAAEIARGIEWIDANVPQDYLVKLLVAPGYHLHALWLLPDDGETLVVVVHAARRLEDLAKHRLHPATDFLGRLRQVQPVTGMHLRTG